MKGLGYRADAVDNRDHRFGLSGPALAPELLRAPDVSAYVGRVRDQGGTGSCVGQALAAALEITAAARQGHALRVAPRWLYAIGREAERPTYRGPLIDGGSFPRIVMDAVRKRGILPERAFPFDEIEIDKRPAPADGTAAFDASGLLHYRINESGPARLEAIRSALLRGYGVLFGMDVDADYQRNEGDLVRSMGKRVGGHMQTVVSVDATTVRVLNSWGTLWGDNGFADFDAAFFATVEMSDIYAVTWVPDVSA